jgi:glycosyl transferase, family 25
VSDQPFDAWYINLDRDVDRRAHMEAELARAGVRADRFPALGADTMPEVMRPAFYDAAGLPRAPMTPGEIGCYASHLALMDRIAGSARPGLVMEDDLRLGEGFAHLGALIDAAPADWAFLRLSNTPKAACREVGRAGATRIVEYWRVPNNAGAYLVSPDGARRFLAAYDERLRPVDEDLRRVWEHGCPTYGPLPQAAVSNIFDSSIDAQGARGEAPARARFEAARRRLGGEPAWRWTLRRWGAGGAAAAIGKGLVLSLRKRLTGARPAPEDHLIGGD